MFGIVANKGKKKTRQGKGSSGVGKDRKFESIRDARKQGNGGRGQYSPASWGDRSKGKNGHLIEKGTEFREKRRIDSKGKIAKVKGSALKFVMKKKSIVNFTEQGACVPHSSSGWKGKQNPESKKGMGGGRKGDTIGGYLLTNRQK